MSRRVTAQQTIAQHPHPATSPPGVVPHRRRVRGGVHDLRPAMADPAADTVRAADGGGGPQSPHGDRRRRGHGGDHGSAVFHGDRGSFAGYTLPLLAAAGAAVAVGTYLRRARPRALLRRSCAATRFQLDAYRVIRMIIDILDRMRTLGGHPACPRPSRHGIRGRGECQRVALVVADSRRTVDDHDTGVPVGVLGFAIPRGYGHLKDAHVVVFEQHPV
jgi:hypothetical protein